MEKLVSNKVKVDKVYLVREIIDSYLYETFEFNLDTLENEEALEVIGEEFCWPKAVEFDELPDKEDFPDEESWDRAVDDVIWEKGEDGFKALLLELAPYLQSGLLILLSAYGDGVRSRAWSVQPDGTDVQEVAVTF